MVNKPKVKTDVLIRIMCNPIYCIEIDPHLSLPHENLIDKAQWINTNARLINRIGAERWLKFLLEVLAGGYVTSEK